ncbi:MAG: hypothetical protein ACYDAJ_07245 [Nitrosotalea sp.]
MTKKDNDSALAALLGLTIGLIGGVVVKSIIDNATKKRKAICPSCKVELPYKVERCPNCDISLRW